MEEQKTQSLKPPVVPDEELQRLDIDQWKRKSVFDFYHPAAPSPQWGITVRLDVTELKKTCQKEGFSYFHASLYMLSLAVNDYEPMRYRIRDKDDNCYSRDHSFIVCCATKG